MKTSGTAATYGAAGWEVGTVHASRVLVDGQQVVGSQAGAIAGPAGGAKIDAEARTTLEQILAALRGHGLIAS